MKADIFGNTRYRLTIFYCGILMFFLLLFMVIVYFVFYYIISTEQKQEVLELASQEWLAHQAQYTQLLTRDKKVPTDQILTSTSKDTFFIYLMDKKQAFLAGEETLPGLRSALWQESKGWLPKRDEVRYKTYNVSSKEQVYLQTTGKGIYDKGHLIGVFYVGRDVTFYFHMLDWLFIVLAGLSAVFLLMASILGHFMAKRAMIPIVEAYNRQQEFVVDASHELRTPLSVVNAAIEVIELEEKGRLSEFSNTVLLDMKDEVRSMTKLVGDLLTLARIGSGAQQLRYEIFDFFPVAHQIIRSLQPLANSHKIALCLEASNSISVNGDKERLRQLVYILLDNAIKYTPGGGEVKMLLSESAIGDHKAYCIKVQDTGIGILPVHKERIFDRFYRGNKNRSRETGGAGLGLAIAKWIVEAHRGIIEVSSNPGKGSVFSIWIPEDK